MSTSLRDQLLKAGLISQKQARDAERQQQHQKQQSPKHKQGSHAETVPARPAAGAKAARDHALNRQLQDKAKEKALLAEIKQLIEQNRLPPVESDEHYNFVDGNKLRRIAVNSAMRGPLSRGEIVIVRHEGRYSLVPAAVAARIRERHAGAVIAGVAQKSGAEDDGYQKFTVPDDLIW